MQQSAFSTILIFAALTLLGLSLTFKIPISLLPQAELARIYVSASYPEAAPLQVERTLTALLEAELATLSEIEEIRSTSAYGSANIQIDFKEDADIDYKLLETRTLLQGMMPKLPTSVPFPQISYTKPNTQASSYILNYSILSPQGSQEMESLIRPYVQANFSLIDGLEEAVLSGAEPLILKLEANETALGTYGISYASILNALSQTNRQEELGQWQIKGQNWPIWLQADALKKTDLDEMIIGWREGQAVRLKDVAQWKWEAPRPSRYYRINGAETLTLSFAATEDANLIALADELYGEMEELKAQLPENYSFIKQQDETVYLRKEVQKLIHRSMLALAFLLGSLLLFTRNLRYAFVLLCSLIANLGLTAILFYVLDLQLHLYSLAGFTVSFGLMIDNSILMIDGLRKTNKESIHQFLPILAATMTTLVSLVTVYFLPEELRANLYEFCYAVALCLLCSLLIAWLLIPALCIQIGLYRQQDTDPSQDSHGLLGKFYHLLFRFRPMMFVLLIWVFGIPVFLLPIKMEGENKIVEVYNTTLGSELYQKTLRPHIDKWLGGASRLFYYYVFERYSYGKPERTALYVAARLPHGYTAQQMNDLFVPMETFLSNYQQDLKMYETTVFSGKSARMRILFTSQGEEKGLHYRLKSQLQRKVLDYSGVAWDVYGVGKGFSTNLGGDPVNLAVNLRGYNYRKLEEIAEGIADSLLKHPRVQEVDLNRTSQWGGKPVEKFQLSLNTTQMAWRNISPHQIAEHIRYQSRTEQPQTYFQWEDARQWYESPVLLKRSGYESNSIYELIHKPTYIDSQVVQLNTLARIERKVTQSQIEKRNQQYLRRISYQYFGSSKFGNRHLERVLKHWNAQMPPGYEAEVSTFQWWFNEENKKWQYIILGIILSLIYIICAAFFESLIYPLIILSIIPMAYLGVFLTFYYFDIPFDQGAFASFLLLAGLTVNHTIFLVYAIRNSVKKPTMESSIPILRKKILPLNLTIISTCAGLTPMLLDQDPFWYPFAAGAIGGLLCATILVFIYIPLFFRS